MLSVNTRHQHRKIPAVPNAASGFSSLTFGRASLLHSMKADNGRFGFPVLVFFFLLTLFLIALTGFGLDCSGSLFSEPAVMAWGVGGMRRVG